VPTSVLEHARQVTMAVERRIGVRCDAVELITGRAALLGLDPPTRVSSGGASRLLACQDGWAALTLSRAEDVEAVPALLEVDDVDDRWAALSEEARAAPAADFVARARLLDMPAAVLGEMMAAAPAITQQGAKATTPLSDLLVADLSSMWAGPLCGRLLAAGGATVVKVETSTRPDGTRSGSREFFDWMNSGKLCYAGDFTDLLRAADVVIEGSRPAAFARRDCAAEQVPGRPGRVWLRISGYGSQYPDRVAFGDDAAVAGGLVNDGPEFCGDAIADPLTGLAATATVLDALASGGGAIIDASMAGVAAAYAALPESPITGCEPRRPSLHGHAHDLGGDNAAVDRLIESRLAAC